MKKTINRGLAIILHGQMAKMAFGHLNEETLEAVMDNFVNLGKVAEHYHKLMDEMRKRLYDGIEDKKLNDYDAMAEKSTEEELKTAFPDIFPLVQKQMAVMASLQNKEVEVELTLVDKKEFVKGALKAKPTLAVGMFDIFEPMFKNDEEKQDADLSELDELLK